VASLGILDASVGGRQFLNAGDAAGPRRPAEPHGTSSRPRIVPAASTPNPQMSPLSLMPVAAVIVKPSGNGVALRSSTSGVPSSRNPWRMDSPLASI
jgi:hypothetical protein